MSNKKIVSRIQKLLNLAKNNPESAEVEAALLQARKLMAEHNLSEGDVEAEIDRREEVKSARAWEEAAGRDHARVAVLNAIAKAHRCLVTMSNFDLPDPAKNLTAVARRNDKARAKYATATVHGRDSDIAVVNALFSWAWEKAEYLAQIVVKKKRAERKRDGFQTSGKSFEEEMNGLRYSYLVGFAEGLKDAYARQLSANPTWGLVLATPVEVVQKVQSLTEGRICRAPTVDDYEALNLGKQAGEEHVAATTHKERVTLKAKPLALTKGTG